MAAPTGTADRPHIALVPTPGLGHLIPLVQLATKLIHSHNLTFTLFLIPFNHVKINSILKTLPDAIHVLLLPPVTIHDLPEDAMMETRISTSFLRSLPAIHSSIKLLTQSRKVSAMITDLCGTATFGLAKEFGVPPYVFFTSNAFVLSFMYNVRKLTEVQEGEFKDMVAPIELPGCVAVHGADLIDSVQVRSSPLYKGTLMLAESYNAAAGIMVNSCLELEPGAFKALNDPKLNKPPVYAIGPLVQTGSAVESDHQCLTWLDRQPSRSVLYVSFGSGGTLSQGQMNELALGLESSGVRFLWVVRSPNDKVASGNYFTNNTEEEEDDALHFLPNGFLERTKDVGLAVSEWVPQVEILGHRAIRGFLSHCGWNSALEAIAQSVPLIAWPLYAEQRMNAALLSEGLGVAIRVRHDGDGLVRQGEVIRCIKGLFEGDELRKRAVEVQSDALGAIREGGSSNKSISEVVKVWLVGDSFCSLNSPYPIRHVMSGSSDKCQGPMI